MEPTIASLLAEVVACRHIVDDYAKRLDEACVEYHETGKSVFPNLSRAEDEDTHQQCERVLNVASIAPDALNHWRAIKYDAHEEQVLGMRDVWVRRRNLFHTLETNMKTRFELNDASQAPDNRKGAMKESDTNRVLIIHGDDEPNLLALKDLLQSKLRCTGAGSHGAADGSRGVFTREV